MVEEPDPYVIIDRKYTWPIFAPITDEQMKRIHRYIHRYRKTRKWTSCSHCLKEFDVDKRVEASFCPRCGDVVKVKEIAHDL